MNTEMPNPNEEHEGVVNFRRSGALIPQDAERDFERAREYDLGSREYAEWMAAGWASVVEKNIHHPDANAQLDFWLKRLYNVNPREN